MRLEGLGLEMEWGFREDEMAFESFLFTVALCWRVYV